MIEDKNHYGLEYETKKKLNIEPGNLQGSIFNNTFGKDFEF